jgi:hypothetical protein
MNAQTINSEINKQLNIQVPIDLQELWIEKGFDTVNRKFIYCNYGEMLFLSNSNLHEYTVSREVSGAMNESNSLYFKQKEDSITENEYRKNKELFFLDPVMTSKMVDGHLRSTYPSIEKCLVFSVSTWQEGFTYLFYGFNENNENLGIWIWKLENSRYPVKVADELSQIFGDSLRHGFSNIEDLNKFLMKYHSTEMISESNFPYGIFPKEDLRQVAKENVSEIVWFTDEYISFTAPEVLEKIEQMYSARGIDVAFDNFQDTYLKEFVDKINKENFDTGNESNYFIIHLSLSYKYGLVLITPEQGRSLNKYSLIPFGGRKETDLAFEFMDY